jgi:hypothetical protein
VCILLTCSTNPHNGISWLRQTNSAERAATYVRSIKNWIHQTQLQVVVVDNSGYEFTELDALKEKHADRLEFITFVESEQPDTAYLKHEPAKGRHEFYAIDYARKHSKLLQAATYIIKITGRYFVPYFHLILNTMGEANGIRQRNPWRCEIVGASATFADIIFSKFAVDSHVENEWKRRLECIRHVFVLPKLKVEPTITGGTGWFTCYL